MIRHMRTVWAQRVVSHIGGADTARVSADTRAVRPVQRTAGAAGSTKSNEQVA